MDEHQTYSDRGVVITAEAAVSHFIEIFIELKHCSAPSIPTVKSHHAIIHYLFVNDYSISCTFLNLLMC